jgi:hypothetical protein
MTCDGYNLLIVLLGLITGLSELLALLKGVECNGILDFVIHCLMTNRRCAVTAMGDTHGGMVEIPNAVSVEIPNVPTPSSAELRIRVGEPNP